MTNQKGVKRDRKQANLNDLETSFEAEGSYHKIGCTGVDSQGAKCLIFIPIWIPTIIPADFFRIERPCLCTYCMSEKLAELENKILLNSNPNSKHDDMELELIEDVHQQKTLEYSVRINGIPESENESLSNSMAEIGKAAGIDIKDLDIDSSYRSGKFPKNQSKPRPVVIKFKNISKKIELLRNKKNLNKSENFKKCFIQSELSFLRWKLFYYLKGMGSLSSVFVRNDSIIVKMNGNDSPQTLKSFRDLKKLGINCNELDFSRLGFKANSN